jgi:hypothetical protein
LNITKFFCEEELMTFGPVPDSSASPREQSLFLAAVLAITFIPSWLLAASRKRQNGAAMFLWLLGLSLALVVVVSLSFGILKL